MKRKPRQARPAATARDRRVVVALAAWFASAARPMPWRSEPRDPYRSLASEFMLQQTQVSRVLEKFDPFIAKFPTLVALADADEQDVLAAWSGLGYYRRARLLHAASKEIVEGFGGVVPRTVEELETISGIGRYTAGSIASIVFGENAAIVDGNVARVVLRLDAVRARHGSKEAGEHAWARAEVLAAEAHRAGMVAGFNEGLMELGATVCTPKSPACGECPLRAECKARKAGVQDEIPGPKQAAKRKAVTHACVLAVRKGMVLLERRSASGMWAGMWQPPTVEGEIDVEALGERTGVSGSVVEVGDFVHVTTHRDVRFVVFRAKGRMTGAVEAGRVWVSRDELDGYGISNAHRRVLGLAWNEGGSP